MKILAIDPGPTESAYVCLDAGMSIVGKDMISNDRLLSLLTVHFQDWILVVEQVASFGMAVGADVFETVFWTGRFCQVWAARGYPFYRITRHAVKMQLCHNMRAKDGNIRQALIDKLGPQGTKKAPGATYGISKHCWSALAVAVTFSEQSEIR